MNKNIVIIALSIAFLFFPALKLQATNYYAVCVGISDYPGSGNDLPEDCLHDAEDMADYLVAYQGWSGGNIEILYDEAEVDDYVASKFPRETLVVELGDWKIEGNKVKLTIE